MFSATPMTSMGALLARPFVVSLVALALASAPALGLAWADAARSATGEPGPAAGMVPFVQDSGHRLGGATSGSVAPGTAGFSTARTSWVFERPAPQVLRTSAASTDHGWLRNMLVGARLQTDGG